MTSLTFRLGAASAFACLLGTSAFAQATLTGEQLTAKRQLYGAAMALQYGIDNCEIETTAKQRTDVKKKIEEIKQQIGFSGDLSVADIKDGLGLKTDQDMKDYCTGLSLMLPASIAGLIADKPPSEWSKPAGTASATPAPSANPAPAAALAPAPAPTKVTVGDWDVGPVEDAPADCMIVRDYNDKDDGDAENAIIVRSGPNSLRLALSYAKWNWGLGQKVTAALVTPDSIIDSDVQWTGDKTGKVLSADLKPEKLAALKQASRLVVKFDDGDADFEVPKIGEALNACLKK